MVKTKQDKQFKFNTVAECPDGVMNLTKEAQAQWMEIANAMLLAGDTKEYAIERAWLAVKEGWTQNDEGEWIPKAMPSMVFPMMPYSLEDPTFSLKGVEVFATGNWNGDKYTEKDLDEMVKNFGIVEAPLKIGHDAKQKISGQPAVGWITKLYKKGEKLFADIHDIPKTVYELVKKGAYKKRSAEILYNFVDGSGKAFNNVFAGLALLGAELPAVNTLEDIKALYGIKEGSIMTKVAAFEMNAEEIAAVEGGKEDAKPTELPAVGGEVVPVSADVPAPAADTTPAEVVGDAPAATETPAETPVETPAEAPAAPAEVPAEETAPAAAVEVKEETPASTEPIVEDVTAIKAENDALKAELAKIKLAEEKSKVAEFVKKIEKKIPPALKGMVEEFILKADATVKKEYALGKKSTDRETIMSIFEKLPDMAILSVYSRTDNTVGTNKEEKVVVMAKELMKTNEALSMKDALLKVYEMNPELITPARNIKE